MRHLRPSITVLAIISCFITIVLYYWGHLPTHRINKMPRLAETTTEKIIVERPMLHVPLNKVYNVLKDDNDSMELIDEHRQVYMIDTPGCKIPIRLINYRKDLKISKKLSNCGPRAVYLRRNDEFNIRVYIAEKTMKEYLRKSTEYECCYRYIRKHDLYFKHGKTDSRYSDCKEIKHGSTFRLEWDFINVQCYDYDSQNVSHVIYNDIYAFAKKISISTQNYKECNIKYNVLMIGMDSMSLNRVGQTMLRTVTFFKQNYWTAFRAYHKIDDNTFPNLMAVITGKNLSVISQRCSWKMDKCKDLLIWNKFKEDGYVTAYGEDYLRLPDTFTNEYAFQEQPTDHYLRPFFMNREIELSNRSTVCAGNVYSGQQLLDYALDFADVYKQDNFFGLFWLNSFSHNVNSRPENADKIFESFFNRLSYTGALTNTFIIFFSDHGIRFGQHRAQMESYFDDRMPFLFIWPPILFTGREVMKYRALVINQFRLITPYDIFDTLVDIKSISSCSNVTDIDSDYTASHSIFDIISYNRTCKEVGIHDKWCSCHNLYPLPIQDNEGMRCVSHVLAKINSMISAIKTKKCWGCMSLELRNILRVHFYYNDDKISLFYVVAFTVSPGNVSYETTVLRKNNNFEIIGPISVISSYRGLGKCTINPKERLYCLCQKIEKCSLIRL
ncbi:uncharacterized protein LOC115443480 [Manduca sexta]|uniref:uncharacterized protein LOC115443480 n=1 Tax=Manduca sexta TaxID=7130 RepID=UPI00188FD241|nr:uncharacterized protein LOC115443480 [Manduca sexta]